MSSLSWQKSENNGKEHIATCMNLEILDLWNFDIFVVKNL